MTKNKKNTMIKIFEILKMYEKMNINNENKKYTLLKHDFNDHVIDFIDDVESSHNSIYIFFENELQILKTYIDKHFANDFIQHFLSLNETFILFVQKKMIF